jgi:hypothetical protein
MTPPLFSGWSMYLQLPVLLVIVSLVYSGTRHDDWGSIFSEAFRWGMRMAGFMLCVAAVMYGLSFLPRGFAG